MISKPNLGQPASERIFDMHQAGVSTAELAILFNMDVFEINRVLYRVRKRRRDKAGEVHT